MVSGGLDSILAARVMRDQGVEVEAVHFVTSFGGSKSALHQSKLEKVAGQIGIKLTVKNISKEFLEIVRAPRHGYGSGVNPCIDCKIFMLRKAKEHMKKTGASFVVTGEVVGQRPMSQMKDTLAVIEKEADLQGLLLRPLCAKLLKPTIPEESGIVDREKLYAISGRGRKPQIDLAQQFGISDYQQPAGGCLLTDPQFSLRVQDLMKHDSLTLDNIFLLKVGRHFRISKECKLVVGRDEKENGEIFKLSAQRDLLMDAKGLPGPLGLLRGKPTADELGLALRIVARYVDKKEGDAVEMEYWDPGADNKSFAEVKPAEENELGEKRI